MSLKIPALLALLIFLSGCMASFPKAFAPNVIDQKLPHSWSAQTQEIRSVGDPNLRSLIDQGDARSLIDKALADNPSIRESALKLREAQLGVTRDSAGLWPTLSLDPSAKRSKAAETAKGRNPVLNNFDVSAGVSWEIDVWGRMADNRTATQLEKEAVEDDLREHCQRKTYFDGDQLNP